MGKRCKILIVDDKVENLIALEKILADIEADIVRANSGNEALAATIEHEFALVLMDVQMPEMDGYEAVALLHQDEKTRHLPVIFISAIYSENQHLIKGIKAGAFDFITKPVVPEFLVEKVRIFLELHKHKKELNEEIKKRKKSEKAFQKSEERYRLLFHSAPDGILIVDAHGYIIDCSKSYEVLHGYSKNEIIGKNITEFMKSSPSDFKSQFIEAMTLMPVEMEIQVLRKNGGIIDIWRKGIPLQKSNGSRSDVILYDRDITRQRYIEKELLKKEKLESVAILAGGIAHDFNNLLVPILGNITLGKLFLKTEDELYDILNDIEKAAMKAKDLVMQLLPFAKGGVPIRRTTSIYEIIYESATFALSGSNVLCEFDVAEDIWPVDVDFGQISQVVNNLVINAKQAMPQGGKIYISIINQFIDINNHLSLKSGNYVKISIKDQGCGIAEENLQKIFDIYFTTKKDGSGLGLATSYSIIKKHDGTISVHSTMGNGTTFDIYLPASRNKIQNNKQNKGKLFHGKGKILVMDDEKTIHKVIGRILAKIGYDAEFALDGCEAIDLYQHAKDSGDPFVAVIMDLTVPGAMGGKEAIEKLLEIDPEVKSIVSSGYSSDPILSNYDKYGFNGFVVKPYNVQELSDVLYRVINNRK